MSHTLPSTNSWILRYPSLCQDSCLANDAIFVKENENAKPKDINIRVEPVFLKRRGTTRIGIDTNITNTQKIAICSNHERVSALNIMYWSTGVNGYKRSIKSPVNNLSSESLENCCFIFLKPIKEKYEIKRKIAVGKIYFEDRDAKTWLTPSGSSIEAK